jgi:hypothetical protein
LEISAEDRHWLGWFQSQKRIEIRQLSSAEVNDLRGFLMRLYIVEKLSTTEISSRFGRSQFSTWSLFKRLGIPLRSREEGGRIYAPKRTPNTKRQFDGSTLDRAYLQGFARGDLDVRRVSALAIMVSSTSTHPAFVSLFESLFKNYGPVYIYPIYDAVRGYKWKVAARLDMSFDFLLPESGTPNLKTREEFLAWLAGLVDSDGSLGIIHDSSRIRINLQLSNEDLSLLRYVKARLAELGYHPVGPYRNYPKGHVTGAWRIRYNMDMHYLTLQRFREVRDFVSRLPLRHDEKRRRKFLILRLHQPLKWKSWSSKVEDLRDEIEREVHECVLAAERDYKRRRESPT